MSIFTLVWGLKTFLEGYILKITKLYENVFWRKNLAIRPLLTYKTMPEDLWAARREKKYSDFYWCCIFMRCIQFLHLFFLWFRPFRWGNNLFISTQIEKYIFFLKCRMMFLTKVPILFVQEPLCSFSPFSYLYWRRANFRDTFYLWGEILKMTKLTMVQAHFVQ